MMTRTEMEAQIRRLAPFRHELELPHGLRTTDNASRAESSSRVEGLVDHAFPALLKACGGSLEGMKVLDLACNSGGFSVEASKQGADYVLGVDIVDRYIEQAEFVRTALGLENVEFRKLDILALTKEDVGQFDVTFCFGLLHHLEDPVSTMRKISAVTRRIMVVDTKTLVTEDSKAALWNMNFASPATSSDNEAASTNLWKDREYCQFKPNAVAVRRLLKFLGFDRVRRLEPTAATLSGVYFKGERATFLATRTTD